MVRMHRVLGFCLLSLLGAACSHAQATPSAHHSRSAATASTASKTKKKSATSTSHARSTAHVNSAHVNKARAGQTSGTKAAIKSGTKGRAVAAKSKRVRPKPAPTYQLHPDPERYQQIQQALADRGYFKGQVNGEWGGDSVDALKRFQTDHKIDPDGKINALSLIGLGLGPKHDGSSGHNAPVAPPPDSPVAPPQPSTPEPQATPAVPPN